MNRTHLEGAAETLASERGYAFHAGPEGDMPRTIAVYPAAWLSPLELHSVEGRSHGRASYDMTLRLLRSGARLSTPERNTLQAEMEGQMLDLFAALSLDPKVLSVENLTVIPGTFSLTPHGEISQTATARIVTYF